MGRGPPLRELVWSPAKSLESRRLKKENNNTFEDGDKGPEVKVRQEVGRAVLGVGVALRLSSADRTKKSSSEGVLKGAALKKYIQFEES